MYHALLCFQADTLLGISAANGGSSYEPGADEVEGAADAQRTKHAIEALQAKIHKTMDLIKIEQQEKEGNWNFLLQLTIIVIIQSDKTIIAMVRDNSGENMHSRKYHPLIFFVVIFPFPI